MLGYRYLWVAFAILALCGCSASTTVRSNAASSVQKTYGNLLSLSLMGTLESDDEGRGFHAACSKSLSKYYENHGVPGAVIALNDVSLNPQRDIDNAIEQSDAQVVLVVSPTSVEYGYDIPDYRAIQVDASLIDPHSGERVWRAQITLRPNTGIYWRGDKQETCDRLVTDTFEQLHADGFRFSAQMPARKNAT